MMANAHALRRAELLDGVLELAATRGMEAVSVREVAAQVGVSPAKVQYYFRTKDELLIAAFRHVEQLLDDRAAQVSFEHGVATALRQVMVDWLPVDAVRARLVKVWIAFLARAVVTDELAAIESAYQQRTQAQLIAAIESGIESGEYASEVDSALEACLLSALVEGLSVRMLTDPAGLPADTAIATLDAHLAVHPKRAGRPSSELPIE
ncbi:TetR/AcrR family transcriptional regulator [Nocardia sp. XZ_19_385]|uniref:TetR/AcrR family transcriptional regulator n=1 Tax=Nocardia sp. XZ_19_385 TaxID=2769488 RepID=UPI00188F99F2|nr:TetR/AcrR family transcriptional regulator [Nocardia sp. XZ_19_385]